MSIGTVTLAALLAGSLAVALVEAILTPRFRGPAFAFGAVLRTAAIGVRLSGADSPAGAALSVAEDGGRFVMVRPHGRIPRLPFVIGTIDGTRGSEIVQARLSLGGPGALGVSAALCGHLCGKLNPFLSQPITPAFAALASVALLLSVATVQVIRTARRDADRAIAELPAELARRSSPHG